MGFFSFLGANQYLKEVEEQERYEEAFNLKKQTLGISKENLELQKETLELKKALQEQNLLTTLLPLISGSSLPTGSKKTNLGAAVTGGGKSPVGKDNEFYAGAIKQQFPYVTDTALGTIMANTNNANGTMKTVYDFLNSTKEQFSSKGRLVDGQIPSETLEYIFSNTFSKTTKPYENIKDLEKQFGFKLSESSKGMLDILTNYSVTNVQLPTVNDPLGQMETKDIDFLKKEAFDVAEGFYKQENMAITRALTYYNEKIANRTITPDEMKLHGWLTKRSGELEKIKGFSRENDTLLINLYGTREAYQFMRNNPVMNKRVFMPEQPPSMSLNIEPQPVVVANHKQMITLRNLGILRVGQKVEFADGLDKDGRPKREGIVPPKGQN